MLIGPPARITCRYGMLMGGVFWIKSKQVFYDYSKYLGPDWKPTYEGTTTYIQNHLSLFDLPFIIYWKFPSLVGTVEAKKFPFIGTIGTALGSYYINKQTRDKELRNEMLNEISKR